MEYASVKGLPSDWTPDFIRAEVTGQSELAEAYIVNAPVAVVDVLGVDASGLPIDVNNATIQTAVLRKPTEEPHIMPIPAEFGTAPWAY